MSAVTAIMLVNTSTTILIKSVVRKAEGKWIYQLSMYARVASGLAHARCHVAQPVLRIQYCGSKIAQAPSHITHMASRIVQGIHHPLSDIAHMA